VKNKSEISRPLFVRVQPKDGAPLSHWPTALWFFLILLPLCRKAISKRVTKEEKRF
jgi:hypothetical protein